MDLKMNKYLMRLCILLTCTLMACGSDASSVEDDYLDDTDTISDSDTVESQADADVGFMDVDDPDPDTVNPGDPDDVANPDAGDEDTEDPLPTTPLFECPAGSTVADGWNTVMVDE